MRKFSSLTAPEIKVLFSNLFFVLLGNMVLAFGSAIFLTKMEIVSGGLSGLGIIIQSLIGNYFAGPIIDIAVFIMTWISWIIGFIFVGKEFAIKTLASSIIYPLAFSMFVRVPFFNQVAESICYYNVPTDPLPTNMPIGNLLICGIFGGVFVGAGVGLNFRGGGSTGGVDVIMAIVNKYFGVKESIVSFIIDGTIIASSMILIPNNIIPSLCGIISAFITASMIETVYISSQTSYQVDIISNKWEEISAYAQDTLGRGATIIKAQGGYKGDERIILRIVFDKSQFNKIKRFIRQVDAHAFVTFTQTNAVYGEGFKRIPLTKNKKK